MKVFVSWSGERSKAVATLLADWIKCVLQASDPWISTRDIERGSVWFNEIGGQLQDISVGIVCLTQENKERPWILFEAGALYKGLNARVCTLLIDLEPADVEPPLSEFNHTLPNEDSMRDLVYMLNNRLSAPLEQRVVDQVFATYWPQFEKKFAEALQQNAKETKPAKPRSEQNLLTEILENTRSLGKRIGALEQRVVPAPLHLSPPLMTADALRKHAEIFNPSVGVGTTSFVPSTGETLGLLSPGFASTNKTS
jgi:TIR domain